MTTPSGAPKRRNGAWRRPLFAAAITVALALIAFMPLRAPVARGAPALSITPITWNVIGLDSNNAATDGPDTFMVGARVCNAGDGPAANVASTFDWDSVNAFINLNGASSLSVA